MKKLIYAALILAVGFVTVQYVLPAAERKAIASFFRSNPDAAVALARGPKGADPIDRDSEIAQIYESYYGVNPYGTTTEYKKVEPQPIDSFSKAAPLPVAVIRKTRSYLVDSLKVAPSRFMSRGRYDVLEVRKQSPFSDDVKTITLYLAGEYVGGVGVDSELVESG